MHPDMTAHYWRVNEIKNYLYCARISFYTLCMGLDRETGLSQMGIEAEADTKKRMKRRKHALHAVHDGTRHFDVQVVSHTHQLIGRLDEVVETETGVYLIDYKDTDKDYGYWKLQMLAYRLCIEEQTELPVLGSYVYSIPTQQYTAVKTTATHQRKLAGVLETLAEMVNSEVCPPPVKQIGKCRSCQYARFCNDVF
jgi:CRISPR-associated protein Cas4